MIGRLVPYKGVDVGISSLVYPAADGWRLAVIGDDDEMPPTEEQRLRALVAELGLSERVSFLGAIPGAGRLVRASEALAVLTRPGQPGHPIVRATASPRRRRCSAGIPVVVAGQGPIARRLSTAQGSAGLVVRPGDPLDTARALQSLSSPTLRKEMGMAGRTVGLA